MTSPSASEPCACCLVGWHSLCLEHDDETCCCGGRASLIQAYVLVRDEELRILGGEEEVRAVRKSTETAERGDSGYIHPDAWPSSRDIGTFEDVASTGRKRVAKMYPISVGQVCEWAGKKVAIPGIGTVVGCVNNPATDIHHGPDKNTFANEKASMGIGTLENVWMLCSECHNTVHALMDPHYPDYDRQTQQDEPWLPNGWQLGDAFELEEATTEELLAQERTRAADRQRRGRTKRGRNSTARERGDLVVADE